MTILASPRLNTLGVSLVILPGTGSSGIKRKSRLWVKDHTALADGDITVWLRWSNRHWIGAMAKGDAALVHVTKQHAVLGPATKPYAIQPRVLGARCGGPHGVVPRTTLILTTEEQVP
jgi:hypothetical protein